MFLCFSSHLFQCFRSICLVHLIIVSFLPCECKISKYVRPEGPNNTQNMHRILLKDPIPGGGGTAIYGPYRYVPL